VDSEEIASYSVRALHACIESYDPERKVPMQAYLRAQLGRRIVDRLRSEGIFTRSEGALVSAMQELLPNYAAGDPISQADIIVLADRFGTTKESVERTILAYARKVRTLRIDFASTDLDDPYLQIPYDGQESIEAIEDRMIANEDARVGVEILSHHLEEENKALLIAWFSSEPGLPNPELDSLLPQIGVTKQEASKRVTRLVSDLQARAKNLTGAPSLTHPNAQHEFSKAVTAGASAMRDLLPV
jgi:DNA-directed RNA polymerase specialized sigma subunit